MLFYSPSGKGFLSGHADGAIVRYFFDDEGSGDTQVCLTRIYKDRSQEYFLSNEILNFHQTKSKEYFTDNEILNLIHT
jgi:hypothetical protein